MSESQENSNEERMNQSEESKEGEQAASSSDDTQEELIAKAVGIASDFEAKKAAAAAVREAGDTSESEVVAEVVRSVASEEAKKVAAVEAMKALSEPGQADLLRQLQALHPDERKAFAEAAARSLPPQAQKELSISLAPTQPVTDWIWKVIVGVFALAFALAVLTLCVAVLWQPGGDI